MLSRDLQSTDLQTSSSSTSVLIFKRSFTSRHIRVRRLKHTMNYVKKFDKLEPGAKVDVRDAVGRWLPAEIVSKTGSSVRIHFIGWEEKWDENIDFTKEQRRLADFGLFSADPDYLNPYKIEDCVWVLISDSVNGQEWVVGFIEKISGGQLRAKYEDKSVAKSGWFHISAGEVAPYENKWNCSACTFENKNTMYCEMCDTANQTNYIPEVSTERLIERQDEIHEKHIGIVGKAITTGAFSKSDAPKAMKGKFYSMAKTVLGSSKVLLPVIGNTPTEVQLRKSFVQRVINEIEPFVDESLSDAKMELVQIIKVFKASDAYQSCLQQDKERRSSISDEP